ncbi:MAG: DUF4340 domain-containing protein [Pirellulales bacterium]
MAGSGGAMAGRDGPGGMRPERRDDLPMASSSSPALVKTLVFLVGGVAALGTGIFVQPRFKSRSIEPKVQRVLFPELSDASKAASLEVVRYDEGLATLKQFKVAQSAGVWVLPAFQNYPADAKDQLAAAATELVDLEYVDTVSDSPGDHAKFGVIEPDPEKIKPGDTGVGELIDVRDANGGRLARLVVGKEDKKAGGADAASRPLRFVRKAGQDRVYLVAIDTSKFTTTFGDWIEKDLLKLSPWDVRTVVLDDYKLEAVEQGGQVGVTQVRKDRIELAYEDREAKWNLMALESFAGAEPKQESLADDEELASARLNELRNALGDLKIVDVARKPAGLSAELKAEESFANDREALRSMQQRGFLPLRSGDILSTDGETIVGMKDGVEYVLRFGAATAVTGADAAEEAAADGSGTDAAGDGRYLLVMARFNESLLEKPRLDPLPGAAEPSAAADPAAAPPAPEGTPAEPTPSTAAPPAADATESGAGAAAAPATPTAGSETNTKPAADATGTAPAVPGEQGEPGQPGQAGEATPAATDAPAGAAPVEPTAPAGADAAGALKQADEAEAKAQKELEERRRVERENRRRQDEYDDKVKAAQKRVRDLNARFADWYYVVSAKEYARIHLDRAAVIQKKSATPAAAGAPPGFPGVPGLPPQ